MNKFNKIFRKSMAIPPGTDYSSGSSPPTNSSYMSGGSGNNSPRNIDNQQQQQQQSTYVGGGSMLNLSQSNSGSGSSSSGGSIASSINKSSPQLTHSNSIANINYHGVSGGGPSTSNLYNQYTPLPCIDFDQLFLQYVQQPGELIKSYYLVHSILSKQSEQNNNHQHHHQHTNEQQDKSSWQPFYKKNSNVLFLILTTKSIILLDSNSNPFTVLKRISIGDIKEIIFETSDLGLFSIELHNNNNNNSTSTNTPNILFFTVGCEKREIQELLNQSFDEILKEYYKNKQDIFILKKCNMLSTVDSSNKKEFKNQVNKVLDEISMYGFSAQDLWEGNTDLKFWASKIRDKMVLSNDERFVIEFILPPADNTSGTVSSKRVFRVPNDISIKEITNFLCCKTQSSITDSSIYTLATIKGKELCGDDILADYGLGSFFDNWQLVLVERGKTRKGGLYNLEVHFPDSPEYRGRYHRVLELDGYMSASKLVNYIGNQMDIAKSHLYCIRLDIIVSGTTTSNGSGGSSGNSSISSSSQIGNSISQSNSTSSSNLLNSIILDDDDYLTTHGLGSKFLKCKLKLQPKKFPKPSKDKQRNIEITQCIVNDMIENAWKQFNERKIERVSIMCNEIIESIIDVTVLECKRASTLSLRMASLSLIGRVAMYKLLAQKEQEELNYFKLDGQKVIVNEAKDLLNSLSPILCPTSTDINLDDKSTSGGTLLHRVAPPPPPPILGFKEFQKKRLPTSIDNHDNHSTNSGNSSNTHKSISIATNGVDMNQILNMRGKLKTTVRKQDNNLDDQGNPTTTDRNIVNFTLRNTKSITKTQNVPVTNEISLETNELMEKLKKRHAAAALDAEDLGDS